VDDILYKTDDDGDIPMDEIRKKKFKIFNEQGKPTKFNVFKTNITGPKMPNCSGCLYHPLSQRYGLF
jgi:hypothetical protein